MTTVRAPETWNGSIVNLWDNPDVPHNGSIPVENLFATDYKTQPNGNEDTHKDEPETRA